MPEITAGDVPFQEAVDFFRGKLRIGSRYWDELRGPIHARAFTVAGATKAALLEDLFTAVDAAIEGGETITDFRQRFDRIVAEHGWSYKGKRGWRTRIIYDTNLRTAHAAGRWAQIQRTREVRPYLQYLTVADSRVRPEHRAWHGIVLKLDDPWWDTHYPPNGWGCRCTVRTLSQSQLEREGLKVAEKAPPLERTPRVNTTTGEDLGKVPKGIDPGWDYNVGKAWLGPDAHLGELVARLPPGPRLQAAAQLAGSTKFDHPFRSWARAALDADHPNGSQAAAGFFEKAVVDFLARNGIRFSTILITITDARLRRMRRELKKRLGKDIPEDFLLRLPEMIRDRKAVVWDNNKPALLYAFDTGLPGRVGKLVVRVNFRTKGEISNSIRSGDITPEINLKDKSRFKVVAGKL